MDGEDLTDKQKVALQEDARERAEAFHAIGYFLMEFSQLEFTIRARLGGRLNLSNETFDIVTSPYDFSMLCTVACKLSSLAHPERQEEITNIYNQCRSLNDERVRVAHGTWTPSSQGISARHVSRGKLEARFHFEDPEELRQLADRAQSLMQAVLVRG